MEKYRKLQWHLFRAWGRWIIISLHVLWASNLFTSRTLFRTYLPDCRSVTRQGMDRENHEKRKKIKGANQIVHTRDLFFQTSFWCLCLFLLPIDVWWLMVAKVAFLCHPLPHRTRSSLTMARLTNWDLSRLCYSIISIRSLGLLPGYSQSTTLPTEKNRHSDTY